MSIRPSHTFVNPTLHHEASDRLRDAPLQASNCTRLFYYLTAPLTPLARYFQPIHFYNLFSPMRANPRDSRRAKKKKRGSTYDGAVQVSCFSQIIQCLKTGISAFPGLWKASAQETPPYSAPYIFAARVRGGRERGGETGGVGGEGSWSDTCKKLDFFRFVYGFWICIFIAVSILKSRDFAK